MHNNRQSSPTVSEPRVAPESRAVLEPRRAPARGLLLFLVLVAFARLCFRLDANNMWWDESLSLQRAEAGWGTLLRGTLTMYDGFHAQPTTDQHPFFFFVLQGILIRLAGIGEFVLRYPSVMAATLLVPVVWVLTRYFERRQVLPAQSARWAAGFAALHPFFLWYGQEARPYALWALLSLWAIYLLFRSTDGRSDGQFNRGWLAGYVLVTLMALTTHYYAPFWLPLHAIYLYTYLRHRRRWLGPAVAIGLILLAGAIGGAVAWQILRQGGGGNFPDVSLAILIPDLVNAFSLGLSVTLDDAIHWLGWLFGALALVGALWSIRSPQARRAGGWLLPLGLLIPVVLILLVNWVQPAYMNARHLSLLGGAVIVLVGGGLGLLWQRQRWVTGGVALLLGAALLYSSINYYTKPAFGKDDYSAMGRYLYDNLLPNDVVLISPPWSWRIFTYYLPLGLIDRAAQQGVHVAYYGAPLLNDAPWPENEALLKGLQHEYRRIWLARSGTHPYIDPDGQVPHWLRDNSVMRLREEKFFSPNSFLDLELFLTQPPVYEGLEPPAQHRVDVLYGDLIRLVGYDIEAPLQPGRALPITLYWQVETKPTVRYKYIIQLETLETAGPATVVAHSEIEPYSGQIPTTFWDPNKTIVEYSALPPVALDPSLAAQYRLTLQLYAADSLEKLPITASDVPINTEQQQAQLPFTLPNRQRR